jgi:RNA polymerase sigma factor (sigma-70 family)
MAVNDVRPSRTPAAQPSDGSLLRRFQAGQPDAATALYLRYAGRLRALASERVRGRLATRLDADDIVQAVFRTFFQKAQAGSYEVPAGEDLWKLLLVVALNEIRAQANYHHAAKRDVRLTVSSTEVKAEREPGLSSDQAALDFLQLTVREALAQLHPQDRVILELRMEGHEVAEIARRTGRSRRTVERILQEGRRALRNLIDKGN